MPISFSCGQCGKAYVVSDAVAGKRATCKACNFKMTVPGKPPTAAVPTGVARPAPSVVPVARAVPRQSGPSAEDLYGLNEAAAPLPRLTPRTAAADPTVADAPVKKKKKKRGFFSSSKKKAASRASSGSDGGSLVLIIRIVLFVVFIGGGIGGWGLLSKSSMEGYAQQLIDHANEGSAVLRNVKDAASASVASTRLKAVFAKIHETIDVLKDKKGREDEVRDVERRFLPRIEAAYASLGQEVARVYAIPGAQAALGIDAELQRLTGGTFAMPRMGPPTMPPQIAQPLPPPMPVQMPQPGPSPGFGPGPQQGMGPRPGFGPGMRPGMPGGPPMGPRGPMGPQRGPGSSF